MMGKIREYNKVTLDIVIDKNIRFTEDMYKSIFLYMKYGVDLYIDDQGFVSTTNPSTIFTLIGKGEYLPV